MEMWIAGIRYDDRKGKKVWSMSLRRDKEFI